VCFGWYEFSSFYGSWRKLIFRVLGSKQDLPLFTRIQIYHHISTCKSASIDQLSTAAMTLYAAGAIAGRLARARARTAWANTRAKAQIKGGAVAYERMVLEELSVDEAVDRISQVVADKEMDCRSPLRLLGTVLVKERVRAHLGLLFIESIGKDADDSEHDAGKAKKEDTDRRNTIEAAKELGGHVGELGRTLERVWKLGRNSLVEVRDAHDEPGVDGEIQALITALVLLRRVFPATSSSGSVLQKNQSDAAMLRRALGSRVFEEWGGLEDARDHAVDMVVGLERKSVGLD
jgi:hypothetical protein